MTIGGVPDMPVVVKDGMKDRRVLLDVSHSEQQTAKTTYVMIDYSTCIVRL